VNEQQSDVILERLMSLHPKVIDLILDRVHRLLADLDHPELRLPPVIHLAGTNGKGSTQAMIRAGLEAAGKLVHAYTSPHLARFHERIRVAGDLISENDLAVILQECEVANQGRQITYFEITTCAAFLVFSRIKADYCLLETGLGGRVDATNVFDQPELTILTPISIDHQQFLGDTLADIAGEKAGILKRGVTCIVGPQPDEALDVIEAKAARIGAPLLVHGQHWHVSEERGRMVYQDEDGLLDLPLPNLIGAHQVENAGAAIAALRNLGFDETAIEAAVSAAEWPARMQRLRKGPLIEAAPTAEIWLDGGHNEAAGAALAEALGRLPTRPLHIICGMLKTKDISGYLGRLVGFADTFQGVSIPGETATLLAAETVAAAQNAGFQASEAQDVDAAVQTVAAIDPHARILICGSLYLAGDVLRSND
jgi:dihydrofolate synthase / folylpolyglutamate synthase